MNLVEKICAVRAEVGAVRKSDKNAQQGFNFRGVDAVVNALAPLLSKHGLVVYPKDVDTHSEQVTYGSKGSSAFRITSWVKYVVTDGESEITGMVCSESMDSGDKGTAKAMSVAYRTFLLQTFTLPTDEPDPDHSIYENPRPPVRSDLSRLVERLEAFTPDRDKRRKLVEYATGVEGISFTSITPEQVAEINALLDSEEGQK